MTQYPQKKDELFRFAGEFQKKLIDEAFVTSIALIRIAAEPATHSIAITRITYFESLNNYSTNLFEKWRNEIIKRTEPLHNAIEELRISELTLIEQDMHTDAQQINTELIQLRKINYGR